MDSRLIKFPKRPVRNLDAVRWAANDPANKHEGEGVREYYKPRLMVLRVIGGLLAGLRYVVFLVMFWLRGLVVGLSSILSIFTLLGFLFAFFLMPEKTAMVWGCGITSFVCFVIMWGYDQILMLLSPQPMMNTL